MKISRKLGLVLLLAAGMWFDASPAEALRCKRETFAQKVQGAKLVFVGRILARKGRKTQIQILKVLKNEKKRVLKKSFWVTATRYRGSVPGKKGQHLMFFGLSWMCRGPILLF